MKKSVFSLLFLFFCLSVSAQVRLEGYRQSEINPHLFSGAWNARWISVPDEPSNAYGIYHFRKTFEMNDVPDKFVIHVSADNRYKLYVNGDFVSLGPARGNLLNWNFETVDIAPYLKAGKNVLAAVVWNYSEFRPAAQISLNETGFIVQGNTEEEEAVNTNDTWVCVKNEAYSPLPVYIPNYYYAVGPGEMVKAKEYPWGWETPDFDDSDWKTAKMSLNGAMKNMLDYPGRMLVPRPIPQMEMKQERFAQVHLAEGITLPDGFPDKTVPVTVPANTTARIILDYDHLTDGYLTLLYSKGESAEIKLGYSESYFDVDENTYYSGRKPKGDRNVVEGKTFIGGEDIIIPDGGEGRNFTNLWWRTWRFLELNISTAEEPLVINDIYATFSAYPFEQACRFSAPEDPELEKMLEIGWRTARLCANETYMDCPYYEQLQYFGDTRIQTMVTMYNTNDKCMVKNALEQGRQSIAADGITFSRYPSYTHQFIPPFSLLWICMGNDYYLYRGDEEYLKTLLPAYRGVLAWFEQYLKDDYSLDLIPHWFFLDWSESSDWVYGGPPREENGNSAIQDLLYLFALDAVARMEKDFGIPSMGEYYEGIASKIRAGFHGKYWDEGRKLFADTHDHRAYSQHTNSMAVLAGIVDGENAKALMTQTLAAKDIAPATTYFTYYVNQALAKAGLGDEFLNNLQQWRDQMTLNLTTWAEMPEPARSDCHAWSSSPNIEFFRILLGIDSAAPGFKKVRISPSLCGLTDVSGTMPHPNGDISVKYKIDADGKLDANITLPKGTSGTFVWKGEERDLSEGEQHFTLSNK